ASDESPPSTQQATSQVAVDTDPYPHCIRREAGEGMAGSVLIGFRRGVWIRGGRVDGLNSGKLSDLVPVRHQFGEWPCIADGALVSNHCVELREYDAGEKASRASYPRIGVM